jgi:hypothetical protein
MKQLFKTKKRIILVAVLAAVLVAGSIVGVAFAQTGTPGAATGKTALMTRVATILGIDQQKLQDAFTQAEKEMKNEAVNKQMQDLVTSGKLTQQQADQYKQWLQSKPQLPATGPMMGGFGDFGRGFGGHMQRGVPPPTTPAK